MYRNLNIVLVICTDGEEKVDTGDIGEGEEGGEEEKEKRMNSKTSEGEEMRETWGDCFGVMEEHLKRFGGMTVTMEEIPYNADKETDDKYRNVKELSKNWLVFQDNK
jgi:hypothetical protein